MSIVLPSHIFSPTKNAELDNPVKVIEDGAGRHFENRNTPPEEARNNERAFATLFSLWRKNRRNSTLCGILAKAHLYGTGTPADKEKAMYFAQLGALEQNPVAQSVIGALCFDKNPADAFYYFQDAAAQGYIPAQYNLGVFHELKRKDFLLAAMYYQQAANQGYAHAQYALGKIYDAGAGSSSIAQNQEMAFELFNDAAEQENAAGLTCLADYYRKGLACTQSYKTAFELYEKAADQRYPKAQYELGHMYGAGRGVRKNETVAVAYFEAAANNGYVTAQNVMGDLFFHGALGLVQSDSLAIGWYEKALLQGAKRARDRLQSMHDGYCENIKYLNRKGIFCSEPEKNKSAIEAVFQKFYFKETLEGRPFSAAGQAGFPSPGRGTF